ncbi:hypothetical protein Scep_027590 [Stephania cephalantha]|uniref:Uncharacterized protein n=1 Tax=Stephania cephalantha TaxID=152367 RepID=A0AAP0EFQ8_9MAGN
MSFLGFFTCSFIVGFRAFNLELEFHIFDTKYQWKREYLAIPSKTTNFLIGFMYFFEVLKFFCSFLTALEV